MSRSTDGNTIVYNDHPPQLLDFAADDVESIRDRRRRFQSPEHLPPPAVTSRHDRYVLSRISRYISDGRDEQGGVWRHWNARNVLNSNSSFYTGRERHQVNVVMGGRWQIELPTNRCRISRVRILRHVSLLVTWLIPFLEHYGDEYRACFLE